MVVPPQYEQYLKYSKLAHEIYYRYTDLVEPFGMDECWLDVTGSGIFGTGMEIAEQIRKTIREELGLTVSIGVSFNKVFAKLGSDMKKPDAITRITRESFKDMVWPLDASEMIYVGRSTEQKLSRYGIHTIGDLAKADPDMLVRLLGINGEKLWIYANGLDTSRVMPCDYDPPIKSIGHGITCNADLLTKDEVRHVFMELSQEVGLKLRKRNLAATRVKISVRDNTLAHREYQGKLAFPTQSYTEIAAAGFDLFCQRHTWNSDIRSLTISAIDLVPADTPIQLDLWTDFTKHKKRLALERTVEDIRRRFGLQSINFAALTSGLKMPAHREVEYKMPSVMYHYSEGLFD